MKKFLSIAAVCILALSCSPLRLAYNIVKDDSRILLTSEQNLYRYENGTFKAALGTKATAKDTVLAILLVYDGNTGKGIFDQGDKIKIRLKDNSEFTLSNLYDREFTTDTHTNVHETMRSDIGYAYSYSPWTDDIYLTPYSVTSWVPRAYTVKESYSYGLYPISHIQLYNIITKGVAKMRVESNIGDSDVPEERTEELSAFFKDLFDCLYSGLMNQKETAF